jgi:hypothetical protein
LEQAGRRDTARVQEPVRRHDRFTVEYARYRESDARCCPSRTSTVTYEVRDMLGGSTVAPVHIVTKRTPPMR